MSLITTRDVTLTYSNTIGESVKKSTTIVTLPEPEHMVCVEMGDRSMSFTMREFFNALEWLMSGFGEDA